MFLQITVSPNKVYHISHLRVTLVQVYYYSVRTTHQNWPALYGNVSVFYESTQPFIFKTQTL